ncbi:hypothetical protein L3Y34_001604 [Caenorhabditis briggsae]|nr:hypothetical protein L3Y34_001604 [Caenorhabditis briggsae]
MAFLLILIIVPSLVQCISKKKEKNRKLDRSTPIVDSRSRVSKKRSVIDVAAVVPPAVPPLKSKDKTLKEQATQDTPPNEAGKAKNKKKKKKSKSKEKTVTKATVSTETVDTVDEKTAQERTRTEKRGKQKTVCATAEENAPSRREQRTQSTSAETAAKKNKKKVKTEEFMESQNDDDTLRCVKSICN